MSKDFKLVILVVLTIYSTIWLGLSLLRFGSQFIGRDVSFNGSVKRQILNYCSGGFGERSRLEIIDDYKKCLEIIKEF